MVVAVAVVAVVAVGGWWWWRRWWQGIGRPFGPLPCSPLHGPWEHPPRKACDKLNNAPNPTTRTPPIHSFISLACPDGVCGWTDGLRQRAALTDNNTALKKQPAEAALLPSVREGTPRQAGRRAAGGTADITARRRAAGGTADITALHKTVHAKSLRIRSQDFCNSASTRGPHCTR